MEKRPLGTSGLEASLVGLGCNNFGMKIDLAASRAVITAAVLGLSDNKICRSRSRYCVPQDRGNGAEELPAGC